MSVKFSILLTLLALTSVQSTPAGLGMSIDIDVVTQFKELVMPMIITTINSVHVDEIEKDNFQVSDIAINFSPVNPDDVQIGLSSADNAVKIQAANVAGKITGSFKYAWLLIRLHGDFEAEIKQGGATFYASMPLIEQYQANTMLPAIKFDMFSLQIDASKIDISISGSITADVLNLFIQLFKGFLVNIIENEINKQTPIMMTSMINTMIYNSHGLLVMEKLGGFGFDFAYTSVPVVSDTQIDLFFNATFLNSSFGLISPNEGFADVLIDPATIDCMQVDISQYTIDSLFLTLHEGGKLSVYLSQALIPALTTTTLEAFLPGLVAKYGDEMPMGIQISTHEAPRTILKENEMGANIGIDLRFIVEGQGTAVVMTFDDVELML